MSAISFAPRVQSASVHAARTSAVLRGLRAGCRAFAGEVVTAAPALRRGFGNGRAERRERARVGRVHLTRRGRLMFIGVPVMLATAAVAMALLVIIAPATVTASTESVQGAETDVVSVAAGESLWDVAQASDPGRDTRVVIAEIVELNDLSTSDVSAGQQLVVPAK